MLSTFILDNTLIIHQGKLGLELSSAWICVVNRGGSDGPLPSSFPLSQLAVSRRCHSGQGTHAFIPMQGWGGTESSGDHPHLADPGWWGAACFPSGEGWVWLGVGRGWWAGSGLKGRGSEAVI